MKDLKQKIVGLVETYARLHPNEIKLMKSYMEEVRHDLQDKKFATAKGEGGAEMVIERKLYEIPETLFTIFLENLSVDEQTDFKSKEMARWFAKEFPLFRVPEKI